MQPTHLDSELCAGCQLLQAQDAESVCAVNLVIVSRVGKSERQHTLLLQVCLVDTGEALHDDGNTTQVAGLQGGVLATAALTIVLITWHNTPTAGPW